MSSIATVDGLKSKSILAIFISVVPLVVVGSLALAAQDRYTLKIPEGLACPSSEDTKHGKMLQ